MLSLLLIIKCYQQILIKILLKYNYLSTIQLYKTLMKTKFFRSATKNVFGLTQCVVKSKTKKTYSSVYLLG